MGGSGASVLDTGLEEGCGGAGLGDSGEWEAGKGMWKKSTPTVPGGELGSIMSGVGKMSGKRMVSSVKTGGGGVCGVGD